MGSYTELIVNNYPVIDSKSYVCPEVMTIFSESDRMEFTRKFSERNSIVWGNCKEEDDFNEIVYMYKTSVGNAIERLEIMGFSIAKIGSDFNSAIREELNTLENDAYSSDSDIEDREKIKQLKSANIQYFIDNFWVLKKKDKPNYLINNIDWGLRYFSDYRGYLRAILESCDKQDFVTQDITEITNAGYYSTKDKVRDIEVESLTKNFEINSKIIILTEGSTDKNIIERSLALLYPHLSDYYSFMDFGLSNSSGGASSLIDQVKGFIGVGIKNKIVAILDNDTAAYSAKRGLNKTVIPSNIAVIHYPKLKLAENYPTIGPTGTKSINVNGLAGSIEMYLGENILRIDDTLTPVQWKGYNQVLNKYQGEVMDKKNVQKRFDKQLSDCEKNIDHLNNYNWSDMKLVLNEIFKAFNHNEI